MTAQPLQPFRATQKSLHLRDIAAEAQKQGQPISAQQPRSSQPDSNHFTKTGQPDRRYKGQRDLPVEAAINPAYTKPSGSWVDEQGIHRTKDGKPDRRYAEARALSEEDALVNQAEYFLSRRSGSASVNGSKIGSIRPKQ